jgi:hypothetical protein
LNFYEFNGWYPKAKAFIHLSTLLENSSINLLLFHLGFLFNSVVFWHFKKVKEFSFSFVLEICLDCIELLFLKIISEHEMKNEKKREEKE